MSGNHVGRMNRRELLGAFAGTMAAGAVSHGASGAKPNILMIYADDLGWGDAGFNGRKTWTTPNMDRLAAEGTVFRRWYTAMPLCAPSRACLLTGKYTIHNTVTANAIDLPSEQVTIAETLKPAGYTTALIGKWHHGNRPDGGFTHPLEQGFDTTFGYLDARHAWEHYPKYLYRGHEKEPVTGYSPDILSEEASKFIRARRSNPFFLYLAFIEPHFLIEAPEEDVALYRGKFKEKDPSKPYNATYAAMIHRMDTCIGRVLKTLDETGLAQNTLVVFTSDNGATFEAGNQGTANYHDSNGPFRGQKRSLEEGGIRMPAVMRWPGRVPAGRVSEEVVHMIDVMPSFAAAAGANVDPDWKVDGVNMLDVWMGKAPSPQRTLFWEWRTEAWNMLAAMRGDFKLLEMGPNHFLYDVRSDPQERRTVAAEHPQIYKELQADLKTWLATEVK